MKSVKMKTRSRDKGRFSRGPRLRHALARALCLMVAAGVVTVTLGVEPASAVQPPPPKLVAHHDLSPMVGLKQANAVITKASHGNVHVLRVFRGPDGLVGVVVSDAQGHKDVVWLSSHGKVILHGGELLTPAGKDITQKAKYEQGLLLEPGKVLAKAADPSTKAVVLGTKGPIVTVFFDANCIYCHALYKSLASAADAGKLRIRYVLVGILKRSSVPRAAAILAASDPAKALSRDETAFDKKHEAGGYPVPDSPDPANEAIVQHNTDLFQKSGANGTPALVYCVKGSPKVMLMQGMPPDVSKLIHSLASGPQKECHA